MWSRNARLTERRPARIGASDRRAAKPTEALASLDGYLRDSRPREHILEAQTLRRTVAQIDALNRQAEAASAHAKDASSQADKLKAAAADAKADANKADASANANEP